MSELMDDIQAITWMSKWHWWSMHSSNGSWQLEEDDHGKMKSINADLFM